MSAISPELVNKYPIVSSRMHRPGSQQRLLPGVVCPLLVDRHLRNHLSIYGFKPVAVTAVREAHLAHHLRKRAEGPKASKAAHYALLLAFRDIYIAPPCRRHLAAAIRPWKVRLDLNHQHISSYNTQRGVHFNCQAWQRAYNLLRSRKFAPLPLHCNELHGSDQQLCEQGGRCAKKGSAAPVQRIAGWPGLQVRHYVLVTLSTVTGLVHMR